MKLTEQEISLFNTACEWWSANNPPYGEPADVRKHLMFAQKQLKPDCEDGIEPGSMSAVDRVLSDYAEAFPELSDSVKLLLSHITELFFDL